MLDVHLLVVDRSQDLKKPCQASNDLIDSERNGRPPGVPGVNNQPALVRSAEV